MLSYWNDLWNYQVLEYLISQLVLENASVDSITWSIQVEMSMKHKAACGNRRFTVCSVGQKAFRK